MRGKYEEQGDRYVAIFAWASWKVGDSLGLRASLTESDRSWDREMGKGTTGYHSSRLFLHSDHCLGPKYFQNQIGGIF